MSSAKAPPGGIDDQPPERETDLPQSAGSRGVVIATLAVLGALGIAVGAAILTGSGIGPVTGGIESVSSTSATILGRAVRALPWAYALGAGMVAAFNPCGFALLPTYLGLYLGRADGPAAGTSIVSRVRRAVEVSATVTASFVLLFGVAGLVLSVAASTLARYLPWAGLSIGVLLAVGAGRMLAGGTLYASLGERVGDRFGAGASRGGVRGYFAYGLAYGTASLSCTLPVFLAVVGSALTVSGFLAAAAQFVLYAAGMGLIITVLTLGVAFFKHAALSRVRTLSRYVEPVSALLLLVAGAYIVYYWLTIGGLLKAVGA